MKDETKETAVPFFAKYLEDQDSPGVRAHVKTDMTLKYPSDRDEDN
jgi:hypothetical protein